jgi:mannose-6-phosphate isomerase-like protein (cupin superfamily)
MYTLSLDQTAVEQWEGLPFRTLLRRDVGGRLEVYELHVTHANPHAHEGYDQVYVVKSGRGRMRIDGETSEIAPGWLVFIPRGSVHSLEPLDGQPVIVYSILSHLD